MRDVLALHCMLASGAAWRGVAAALPHARLACPDLPGHGRAPDWDGGDFMDQALDLAMAAAPAGRFDVVGHSFGGCLGLRLLADHPARVRSLTLIEPVMFAAAPPALQAAERDRTAPFHADLARGARDDAARGFTAMWGDGRGWDAMPERQRVAIRDRIHLVAASGPGITGDADGLLSRLPAAPPPVLIVTRTDPPAITDAIAKGLADRLAGARIRRLGQGHMIPMTDAPALAEMLEAFWK